MSELRESFEVVERLLQSGIDSLPRHEVERARLLLINIAPALINARSERAEVLEEAATVAEDKGAEYEKLGDYGVNQGYVRKVEAANEIAAAIRALITTEEGKYENNSSCEDSRSNLDSRNSGVRGSVGLGELGKKEVTPKNHSDMFGRASASHVCDVCRTWKRCRVCDGPMDPQYDSQGTATEHGYHGRG